jgi:dipeptidyl aminopeptidase/acylaminoacyl peptidase
MSFHPDIVSIAPFVPHDLAYLDRMRSFPEGAVPQMAYDKLIKQYNAASDIKIERIKYLSDNLNITGLIAAPVGRCKGVVIYNRGGSGNYGMLTLHAIMRHFIPLARAGYFVIGSNYRGNDGGDGQDEFGGRDVDDVFKLHEIARAHPAASHPDNFLIGHSRGGMTSFLMLRRGFKARAAIGIAPVCDVREWNTPGNRMREIVYKRFIPGFLDDDEAALSARSVLDWPEAVTCPLLLLHGTKDEAVPHSQSLALSMLLEKPEQHELVLYQGGNHALVRHWDDVTAKSLGWLEAYA